MSLALVWVWAGICLPASAQADACRFHTARLKAVASRLSLQGLDTLPPCADTRIYTYKGQNLHIRKNEWGEVSHIGYAVFPHDMTVIPGQERVLDFVERYVLDFDTSDREERRHLLSGGVRIWGGNIQSILSLTGNETVGIGGRDMLDYGIVWKRGEKEVVSMTFPMDAQLLFGCNAIELEDLFLRDVVRFRTSDEAPYSTTYGREYDTFLVDGIRSELFRDTSNPLWLTWSRAQWRQSLSNLFISGLSFGDYTLDITLDKYGYRAAGISVPLSQWTQFCQKEGCRIYVGIKDVDDVCVTATIFAANYTCGYCHMLSVKVDLDILGADRGVIAGRMYAYIPLHNISPELFVNNPNISKN